MNLIFILPHGIHIQERVAFLGYILMKIIYDGWLLSIYKQISFTVGIMIDIAKPNSLIPVSVTLIAIQGHILLFHKFLN